MGVLLFAGMRVMFIGIWHERKTEPCSRTENEWFPAARRAPREFEAACMRHRNKTFTDGKNSNGHNSARLSSTNDSIKFCRFSTGP